MPEDKLIFLERKNPTCYEIHRGEISLARNLVLVTYDMQFAKQIVKGYNQVSKKKSETHMKKLSERPELRIAIIDGGYYWVRSFHDKEFEPAKCLDYYGNGRLYFRFTNGGVMEVDRVWEIQPLKPMNSEEYTQEKKSDSIEDILYDDDAMEAFLEKKSQLYAAYAVKDKYGEFVSVIDIPTVVEFIRTLFPNSKL